MKKRIWSLLLALILVCSLLPGAALAEDTAAPPTDGTVKTVGQFQYTAKGGTWTLTQYTGSASSVKISSKVDDIEVTAIGEYVFSTNKALTSVTIPKTVVSIGKGAFNECSKLSKVTIAAGGLTTIGDQAFNKCGVLTGVALPYGVTTIGESAFSECTKLTSIDLPDTLTTIGSEAFFASGLTKIAVPGSVTTIGNKVFLSCKSLATVTLGGGLEAIGQEMFSGCSKMTKLVIPDTVKKIGESAFQSTGLTVMMLPETVESIEAGVFLNCTNLQNLCIPSKITALPANTITGCMKLTVIHYTGTGDLGGLPPVADGAKGIEVHHATPITEKKTNSTCSVEGTEEAKIVCQAVGCKSSLPTEIRPIAKTSHEFVTVPAVAATCTASGKTEGEQCKVCKIFKVDQEIVPALGHTPKATDTIEIKDPTCAEPGHKIVSQVCDVCGATLQSTTEILDPTGNHVAAADPVETVVKAPTCGEDGEKSIQVVCKDCGASIGDPTTGTIPATGEHTWGAPTTTVTKKPSCTEKGEQVEKIVCTVCGAVDSEKTTVLDIVPHQADETKDVTTTTTATCTEAGIKTTAATCKECGASYMLEEEEDALGHDFSEGEVKITKEPTCTEAGERALGYAECRRDGCQEVRQTGTEAIPALGHERQETIKDEDASKAATCTEEGVEVIQATVCTRCNAPIPEERKTLPITGHIPGDDLVTTEITAPTCTQQGLARVGFTCSVCGTELDGRETAVPAKGHTFGEWTVTKEATATEAGSRERTCSVCQEKETEVIPATGSSKPEDPEDPDRYYDIDLIRTSNGSVSVPSRAASGDTVTLTVRPYSGYELDSIEVIRQSSGRTVRLNGRGSNRYTFTMPSGHVEIRAYFTRISSSYTGSSSTWRPSTTTTTTTAPAPVAIQPVPRAVGYTSSFSDVPAGHWAAGEVAWAAQQGFMSGVGDGRFNPGGNISYQQLWMVLGRFMGANPGSMEAARFWAVENGFAEGTNPVSPVTRQQMVVALYRCAWLMGNRSTNVASLTNYVDSRNVAASARNAMGWAVANGIIGGNADACLNPNGLVTRDQFAVFLYRFSQRR